MFDLKSRERGQVIPLFAIFLLVLVLMASLLVDASWALLTRRQAQDAADAAAMAAANAEQGTARCATVIGGTTPVTAVVNAARASVHNNLGAGFPNANITVKCRPDVDEYAVEVNLKTKSPGFFGVVAGYNGFDVATTAVAVNGPANGGRFSVVVLDPTGCTAIEFGGGIYAEFDGSMKANSNCNDANDGAIDENGTSATVQLNNGSALWARGTITDVITVPADAPRNTGAGMTPDPYAWLTTPWNTNPTGWASGSASRTVPSGSVVVLSPGRYDGGINLSGQVVLMQPGVYVMNNGGFSVGSTGRAYSVNQGTTTAAYNQTAWETGTGWATNCTAGSCGVLIYNRGGYNNNTSNCGSNSSKMGILNIQATGALVKLRPYAPAADTTSVPGYSPVDDWKNMLFWQAPTFTNGASPTCDAKIAGGGAIFMLGGIYVPSGAISFMGNGGGGGGVNDMTIQFVSNRLQMQGSSHFHFIYNVSDLPRQNWYGLIQ